MKKLIAVLLSILAVLALLPLFYKGGSSSNETTPVNETSTNDSPQSDDTQTTDSIDASLEDEAPEPDETAIDIEGGGSYHKGFVYNAFAIKNKDENYAFYLPTVTITAYDKKGNVLSTHDQTMYMLLPGETQKFSSFFKCKKKYAKLEFTVETDMTTKPDGKEVYSSDLKVSKVKKSKGTWGSEFTGIIKNKSSNATNLVLVNVIFYKNGKIVGGGSSHTKKIKPGKKRPFSIEPLYTPKYDKYEISVYNWT